MQIDWTILQSKSFDRLRFPLAVAVVVLHHGVTLVLDATGALKVLCIFFQEGICRLAVPAFFFFSGYLFFNKLQEWSWQEWGEKLKRRVWSLFVPYILWNLITFFAYWLFGNIHGEALSLRQHFANLGGLRMFWSVNGSLVQGEPIDGPLWFIRDLMVFTLLAPVWFRFFRWTKSWGVCVLCAIFLFVPGIIPEGLIFFLIGAFFQLKGINVVRMAWPYRKYIYLVSILTLIAIYFCFDWEYGRRFVKILFFFSGVASLLCLAVYTLLQEKPKEHPFLVKSSFFIFAAHSVLILNEIVCPLMASLLPLDRMFWACCEFFLTPATAVLICLGVFFVMVRAFPRATAVLTGRIINY